MTYIDNVHMIKILFDSELYVVCLKPSGVISEDKADDNNSLPQLLCKSLGIDKLFTVHRLDKEVGGVMVYAKTSETAAHFSKQINDGSFKKEYVAEVSGKLEKKSDELCDLLFHDRARNKTFVVKRKRNGVKEARLEYTLLSYDEITDKSTVRIKLFTGRTHQIRVQLSNIAHPVCGDRKYGAKDNSKPMRLYSYKLSFTDPQSHKDVTFSAIPEWCENL